MIVTQNFKDSETVVSHGVVCTVAVPVNSFVNSCPAVENIVTANRDQRIMTATTSQNVAATKTDKNVVAFATIQQFVRCQ